MVYVGTSGHVVVLLKQLAFPPGEMTRPRVGLLFWNSALGGEREAKCPLEFS